MISYYYSCDGGSLCLGLGNSKAYYCNNIGDGEYEVFISGEGEQLTYPQCTTYRDWDFLGKVEGEIKVYDYDGVYGQENVLVTLKGRYGVFAKKKDGDMFLQKWED